MLTILFLASNPSETARLKLDKEFREIEENIKKSEYSKKFNLISKWAVRVRDLQQAINETNPDVIHFSGHGEKSEIILEGDDNKEFKVPKVGIIRFLNQCKTLKLVLFNICKSEDFARELVSKIDYAIGMKGPIGDNAAIYFAYRFYSSLGFCKGIDDAYENALTEIALYGHDKYVDTPQIFYKDGVNKNKVLIEKEKSDDNNNRKSETIINVTENIGQINIGTDNSEINASFNSYGRTENIKKKENKFKVFLSSTHLDLIDYKKAVYNAVNAKNQKYYGLQFVGDLENELIKPRYSLIDNCDLFIGVYAWKYGLEVNEKSITEIEYKYAQDKNIPCMCYLLDEEYQWTPKLIEFNKIEKLNKFKSRISEQHKKVFFKDTKHLEQNIIKDISDWFIDKTSRSINNNIDENIENSVIKYKRIINDKYKKLPMVGFDRVFDMKEIYIPLTVHTKNESFNRCSVDIKNGNENIFEKLLEAKDLIDIKLNDNELVVLADPGMGKTTMLKYITFISSEENKESVPIFVKLSDFCSSDKVLEEYLITLGKEFCIGFENKIKELIDNGRLIVLLDGLDEVKRSKYSKVTERISNFVSSNKECRVIITSRINGFENHLLPYPVFEIDNLPVDKIKSFVDRWFGEDVGLLDKIVSNERILELAYNPFLLSIICLIFEKDNKLPSKRADLYEKCVNTLLTLRDTKEHEESNFNSNIFSKRIKEKVLINIAFENFTKGINEFSYNSIYDSISKTKKEFDIVDNCEDSILKEICENSGILHKSDDKYLFLHRTFYEYYVSLKIKDLPSSEVFKYIKMSKWEEPLRLYAGQINSVIQGTEFIKNVWEKDKSFAIRCLSDMDKVIDYGYIKKMLSGAGINERIKLVKELPEKLDDEDKVVETLRGLFKHETNGEVIYWGVKILEKSSVPGAKEIVEDKLDKGAKDRYEKYVKDLMVKIPKGEFMMGSENGRDDEKPVHKVRLDGFYMSKFVVTNELYERFDPEHRNGRDKYSKDDKQPVIWVNWYEASVFARWIGCGLPTEAQWEYACRAGTTTEYNVGEILKDEHANFRYNINKTTSVDKYKPNKWELYDMYGNVWEWCKDWYDKNFYMYCKEKDLISNSENKEVGTDRVLRGGSWLNISVHCRSAYRFWCYPVSRNEYVGFRLCFSV